MLVLARQRRGHVEELFAGRPRPHGRERPDLGDLRILQRELQIRAGRGRRRPGRRTEVRTILLMIPVFTPSLRHAAGWSAAMAVAILSSTVAAQSQSRSPAQTQ